MVKGKMRLGLWFCIFLILFNSPSCHCNKHRSRANRILDRITQFIASNVADESKAKLLGVLMNVSDTVPVPKPKPTPVTVPTKVVSGPESKRGKDNDLEPIDQLLMDAAEPGTAFNEPELLADSDVVKFDGDILMQIDQFAKMQRNVTLSLFEEALQNNLEEHKKNVTLLGWMKSLMPLSRKARAARRDPKRFWKNGVVPIRIDSNRFRRSKLMTPLVQDYFGTGNGRSHKRRIALSMNSISKSTCVCFDIISKAEALAHKPHVRIVDGNGCRSYVGYSVRLQHDYLAQDLTLGRRCRRAFSLNGDYTIVPKGSDSRKKYLSKIGRSRFMSRSDKAVLNKMYNCPSQTSNNKPTCSQYPYVFPPNDRI